jgi:hypothetical protein
MNALAQARIIGARATADYPTVFDAFIKRYDIVDVCVDFFEASDGEPVYVQHVRKLDDYAPMLVDEGGVLSFEQSWLDGHIAVVETKAFPEWFLS